MEIFKPTMLKVVEVTYKRSKEWLPRRGGRIAGRFYCSIT